MAVPQTTFSINPSSSSHPCAALPVADPGQAGQAGPACGSCDEQPLLTSPAAGSMVRCEVGDENEPSITATAVHRCMCRWGRCRLGVRLQRLTPLHLSSKSEAEQRQGACVFLLRQRGLSMMERGSNPCCHSQREGFCDTGSKGACGVTDTGLLRCSVLTCSVQQGLCWHACTRRHLRMSVARMSGALGMTRRE